MVDFGSMADKAKDWAGENPEKADGFVEKGADFVGQRFGHEEQADQAGEKVKDFLHGGQEEGQAPPPPPPGEEPPRP